MANKNQTSEDTNGLSFAPGGVSWGGSSVINNDIIITSLGSVISTLAASTKDESTSSPEQNQMRSESQRPPEVAEKTAAGGAHGLTSSFSTDRKEAMDLEAICPLKEAPPIRRDDRGPPLSADLLEHHRRSRSVER